MGEQMTRMERIAKLQLVSEAMEQRLDRELDDHVENDVLGVRADTADDISARVHKLFVLRQFMAREIQVAQAEAQAAELKRFEDRGAKH